MTISAIKAEIFGILIPFVAGISLYSCDSGDKEGLTDTDTIVYGKMLLINNI